MSILEELQKALLAAVDSYQIEKTQNHEPISKKRKADIEKLKTLLANSTQDEAQQDAVLLRQAVEQFLDKMDIPWLARNLPILFGDELHEKIQSVLDDPKYRESTLMARERAEEQQAQKKAAIQQNKFAAQQAKILGYLEKEDIKGLVITIETLENQLELSQEAYQNLSAEHDQLKENYDQVCEKNKSLEARNQQLEAELAELKKQQNNSSNHARKPEKTTEYSNKPFFNQ